MASATRGFRLLPALSRGEEGEAAPGPGGFQSLKAEEEWSYQGLASIWGRNPAFSFSSSGSFGLGYCLEGFLR